MHTAVSVSVSLYSVLICIVIADGDVGAVQAEHAAPLERYPNPQIDCGEAFP